MSPETVIVAEDSPPNRMILAHLLRRLGYQVIACEHGQQALDQLNDTGNDNIVAVVSDLMMPGVDGLSLLKAIRESARTKDLPVLLITAMNDKEYIEKAKGLGVNGYILKPVTFERVSSKFKELFPNRDFSQTAA